MTKHFSITVAAEEILEKVSKRLRSRFVSDAIIAYSKKKGTISQYQIAKPGHESISDDDSTTTKEIAKHNQSKQAHKKSNNNESSDEESIVFDEDF